MNHFPGSIAMLKDIVIDPDFESACPTLTEDEFTQLEQNVLSDGEVTSPLIVWDNRLIDGHHRRQIILKHPELPFRIKKVDFDNKYEAIAWICKNQTGRRNLTPAQLTYLIGKRYEAEKHTNGASDGFRGNQYTSLVPGQFDHLENPEYTSSIIAKEYGVGEKTVRRAELYAKGVDAAEAACPGLRKELLSGPLKPTKAEVSALSKLPAEEVVNKISEYLKAQEERAEKRRQAREKIRRKADEEIETAKCFSSIGEFSAHMAQPKRRNDVSNVLGIITSKAQEVQDVCETYIGEFPELLAADKPQLLQALNDLREYINALFKE